MYRGDNGTVSHISYKVNDPVDFYRPCGLCINCRLRRAQDWAIRMVHESKSYDSSCFVTLTYDDANLPSDYSLNYSHVSLFLKRLRKQLDPLKISFYRVGEYGGLTKRPHYHLLIFNYDFRDIRTYRGSPNHVTVTPTSGDHTYYKSSFADNLWGLGFVDIGYVDYPTAQYVAKYVTKKQVTPDLDYAFEDEKSSCSKGYRYPQFRRFPKDDPRYNSIPHPLAGTRTSYPIGHRWIQKYFSDVYPHDYVVLDGKKLQPPRYYDRWLENFHPTLWSQVKAKREDAMSSTIDLSQLYNSHFIKLQKHKSYLRDGIAPTYTTDEVMLERKLNLINSFKGILT